MGMLLPPRIRVVIGISSIFALLSDNERLPSAGPPAGDQFPSDLLKTIKGSVANRVCHRNHAVLETHWNHTDIRLRQVHQMPERTHRDGITWSTITKDRLADNIFKQCLAGADHLPGIPAVIEY